MWPQMMDKLSTDFYYPNKYAVLLGLLFGLLLFSSFDTQSRLLEFAVTSLFAMVFAVIVYIIKHEVFYFYLAIGLALVGTLVNILATLFPFMALALLAKSLWLSYFIMSIILFSRAILQDKCVTQDTILGAICVYLFIGIAFGLLYKTMALVCGEIFSHPMLHQQPMTDVDYYYFSFITLTTVGFGDYVITHSLAKVIVIIESITGIFYLAAVVAKLVSRSR